MKQITAEDVRKLREETGEGLMACHKILLERAAEEEKAEILATVKSLYYMSHDHSDYDQALRDILEYLVRKA